MGRLVSAQRTCSRMDLFQDAVAGIFTHAHRRGYSRRMVHSTWTRFLWRYWDAASVTTQELRAWFHRVWKTVQGDDEGSRGYENARTPRWNAPVPPPLNQDSRDRRNTHPRRAETNARSDAQRRDADESGRGWEHEERGGLRQGTNERRTETNHPLDCRTSETRESHPDPPPRSFWLPPWRGKGHVPVAGHRPSEAGSDNRQSNCPSTVRSHETGGEMFEALLREVDTDPRLSASTPGDAPGTAPRPTYGAPRLHFPTNAARAAPTHAPPSAAASSDTQRGNGDTRTRGPPQTREEWDADMEEAQGNDDETNNNTPTGANSISGALVVHTHSIVPAPYPVPMPVYVDRPVYVERPYPVAVPVYVDRPIPIWTPVATTHHVGAPPSPPALVWGPAASMLEWHHATHTPQAQAHPPAQTPRLAIEWKEEESAEGSSASTRLGKRRVGEADEDGEGTTQGSQGTRRKRLFTRQADWPPEWR